MEDLLSLKLKPTEVKKNVTDYVRAVETHYTDIIEGQKVKIERTIKNCNKKVGQVALRIDERSELQDILIDALEKTKLQIFKRKLKTEKLVGKKRRGLSDKVNEITRGVERVLDNQDQGIPSNTVIGSDG